MYPFCGNCNLLLCLLIELNTFGDGYLMIFLLYIIFYLPIFSNDQNCNNQEARSVSSLINLAMLSFCKKNVHDPQCIKKNYAALNSVWKGNFDQTAFEKTIVIEDERLNAIKNKHFSNDPSVSFKSFLSKGLLTKWVDFGQNPGTYLVTDDTVVLHIADVYDLRSTENDDTVICTNGSNDIKNTVYIISKKTRNASSIEVPLYIRSLHAYGNSLYIGGCSEVFKLDVEKPNKILAEWHIKEDAFISYMQQIDDQRLFIKTKFIGAFIVYEYENKFILNKCFNEDECQWIQFSPTLKKAAIRDGDNNLYVHDIADGKFKEKQNIPLSKAINFIFLPSYPHILVVSYNDSVSKGYSFYNFETHHILARVQTNSFIKHLYAFDQSLLAYSSTDEKLFNLSYTALLNYIALKKAMNPSNNNETINTLVIDKISLTLDEKLPYPNNHTDEDLDLFL